MKVLVKVQNLFDSKNNIIGTVFTANVGKPSTPEEKKIIEDEMIQRGRLTNVPPKHIYRHNQSDTPGVVVFTNLNEIDYESYEFETKLELDN